MPLKRNLYLLFGDLLLSGIAQIGEARLKREKYPSSGGAFRCADRIFDGKRRALFP